MTDDDTNTAFLNAVRESQERTELASTIYSALKVSGELGSHRTLSYRCVERCSLLDLVDTPEGLIVGFPRYKTSPATTEATSSESGRQKNTEDGWRRWRERAAFVESVSNPPLACDHMHNVPLSDAAIRADLEARHAEVIVRRDGSRYTR